MFPSLNAGLKWQPPMWVVLQQAGPIDWSRENKVYWSFLVAPETRT